MKAKDRRLLPWVAVLLAFPAPWLAAAESNEPVAMVGKLQFDAAALERMIAAQPAATRSAIARNPAQFEQWLRGELVNRTLLEEARVARFETQPATTKALEALRGEALARLWLQSRAEVPADYPAEAELRKTHEQLKDTLRSPVEFRLAQLFVAAPDGAEPARLAAALRKITELAPKLLPPADFAKLAREHSEQADGAARDGDSGWLREDQLLPAIQVVARGMKVGEVAGPVKTAQGFHFLKLVELRPARPLTFEEARPALVASLRARRAQELQQQYLLELGRTSPVTLNQIALERLRLGIK
jgi:parvulin-like peptidyl-prolyl isomerase